MHDRADARAAVLTIGYPETASTLPADLAAYRDRVLDWELMREWADGAKAEADEIIELEVEF